jgi:hypothetical protein
MVFVVSARVIFAAVPYSVLYSQAPPAGNAVGRGEYLVEKVARCECHTPKNAQGKLGRGEVAAGDGGVVQAHKAVCELGLFGVQACRAAEFLRRSGANGAGQGNRPQWSCDSAAEASLSPFRG